MFTRQALQPFLTLLLAGLLVSFIGLAFAGLDGTGFERRSECRTAVVAREMLDSGDFVLPTLNGTPRLKKPPLYYWAILPFAQALGGVSEAAARLPSVLSATLTALVLALFVWYRFPRVAVTDGGDGVDWRRLNVSLLSGLILIAMPGFWLRSGLADAESMLSLACFVVVVALYWNLREARTRWLLLAYFFSGIALLAKGPVFLLFTWPAYLWFDRKNLRRQGAVHCVGLLLTVFLALPWYLFLIERQPDAFAAFSKEISMRFEGGAIHPAPFYFYFYEIFVTTFPVALWLPAAAMVAWRRAAGSSAEGFLGASILIALGGLSFLQTKQSHYLMPLLPVVAVLVTDLCVVDGNGGKLARAGNWIALIGGGLVAAAAVAGVIQYGYMPGVALWLPLTGLAMVLLWKGRLCRVDLAMGWTVVLVLGVYWHNEVLVKPVRNLKYDQSDYFSALRSLHDEHGLVAGFHNPCFFYDFGQRLPEHEPAQLSRLQGGTKEADFLVVSEDFDGNAPGRLVAMNSGHGGWLWSLKGASAPSQDEARPVVVRIGGEWAVGPGMYVVEALPMPACGHAALYRGEGGAALKLTLNDGCGPRELVELMARAKKLLGSQLVRWKFLWLDRREDGFSADGILRRPMVEAVIKNFVKHQDVAVVLDPTGILSDKALKKTAMTLPSPEVLGDGLSINESVGVVAEGDKLWLGPLKGGTVEKRRVWRQDGGAADLVEVAEAD